MLNSLTTKLAFIGGVGLISVTTLGHSLFDWGGWQSSQGNTSTLGDSPGTTRTGEEDSQHPKLLQEQIKETKDCYSALSFNSKEYLLVCPDKGNSKNLAFYYYNLNESSSLLEKIVSLKAQKESGTKLTITLKKDASNQEITLKNVPDSSNTPWFWGAWTQEKELQLDSLCQRSNIFSEHHSNRRNLTCEWKLKEKDGKETWQLFQSWK